MGWNNKTSYVEDCGRQVYIQRNFINTASRSKTRVVRHSKTLLIVNAIFNVLTYYLAQCLVHGLGMELSRQIQTENFYLHNRHIGVRRIWKQLSSITWNTRSQFRFSNIFLKNAESSGSLNFKNKNSCHNFFFLEILVHPLFLIFIAISVKLYL